MFKQSLLSSLLKSSVVLITVVAVSGLAAWAANTDSYSESQKDTLKCTAADGCNTFTQGKFTAKALFFAGQTLTGAVLNANTEFDIIIGGWEFDDVLGDAAKVGHGSATFNLTDQKCDNNDVCKDVTHGTVKVGISSKGLAVAVSTKTGATLNDTEEFETSPIADTHAADDDLITDTMDISIQVNTDGGDFSDGFTVNVSGAASTKTVDKGDNGSFDLNSVKVKATGIAQ